MTRAVIELSGDISPAMPHMSKLIKGCAYNPENHIMAFHLEDKRVIVEARRILINNAEDEMKARIVAEWLKDIVNSADKAENG